MAGAREKLETFLANAIQWTFWPSLVATLALLAVGKPVLALFGEGFEQGYPYVRAAVGCSRAPVAGLTATICWAARLGAVVYAAALSFNLVLCCFW